MDCCCCEEKRHSGRQRTHKSSKKEKIYIYIHIMHTHIHTNSGFFFTYFHLKALACWLERQQVISPAQTHSLQTFTYLFILWRETTYSSPEGGERMKASMTAYYSILRHSIAYSGGQHETYSNKWVRTIPCHPPDAAQCARQWKSSAWPLNEALAPFQRVLEFWRVLWVDRRWAMRTFK